MSSELIRKNRKTIELGRAIERAVEQGCAVTKAEIGRILADLSTLPLEGTPPSVVLRWHYIGSRNPKPYMDELIHWMWELGRWSEPHPPNTGEKTGSQKMGLLDYRTEYEKCRDLVHFVNDYFIKVPRFASPGRTKGTVRPKVTPEVKEGVRAWLHARNKKSRCSVTALARKLRVSRSTIYRVIEEIR
jgi:hypothetical protein